jgi:hypothetical protein
MTVMAFRNSAVGGRPGYAWLEIDAAVAADVTFILSCPSRPSSIYLGPNGWQGSAYEWKPLAVEGARTGTGVCLQIGPAIVDRLQPDLQVRIDIPSAEYQAVAYWDPVPLSGTPLGGDLSDDQAASEVRAPKPAVPRPEIKDQTRDKPKAETRDEATDRPKVETREKLKVETREPIKDKPKAGAGLIAVAAVIAGLIVGVVLGWLYVSADLANAASRPPAVSLASADDVIRLLAGGEAQPERLYQAGIDLRGRPGGSRDIALQAIARAAGLGYGPARLWLAQTADPARADWKSVRAKPDAVTALEGYEAAIGAGSSEAAAMHVTLCGYLRASSQITDAEQQAVSRYCH